MTPSILCFIIFSIITSLSFTINGQSPFLSISSAGTMRFTENKGQVSDQRHQPKPDVLFYGQSNDISATVFPDHVELIYSHGWGNPSTDFIYRKNTVEIRA